MSTKELLLKEICSRFPYGVKAHALGWDESKEEYVDVALKIYQVNTDGYVYFESNNYDVNYVPVEDCRMYLRPMSSMTEEEKKEFSVLGVGIHLFKGPLIPSYDTLDWLNAHHFDFRGLIEKGLAIEVTEEHNPYEN